MVLRLLEQLERQPRRTLVVGTATVVLLGAARYFVHWEISFSVLFLLPVAAVAWGTGRYAAVSLAVLSAVLWLHASFVAGAPAAHPLIPYWNASVGLVFFVSIALLVDGLRHALQRERALARTDALTGVSNSRAFHAAAELELARSHRYGHPFALLYLDLDDFKRVNDELGHAAGDRLLSLVAASLRASVRRTDLVARLGGDEFALLLPETEEAGAQAVLHNAAPAVARALADSGWRITFSAGGVVCADAYPSVDAVLHAADELMYASKRAGKDGWRIERLGPPRAARAADG